MPGCACGIWSWEFLCRIKARRYKSGVYADEVLQHYFPPSMAVISAAG